MHRALRLGLVVLGAVAAVSLLFLGAIFMPAPDAARLSRKEVVVGVLALGVLGVVATGFDVREWL